MSAGGLSLSPFPCISLFFSGFFCKAGGFDSLLGLSRSSSLSPSLSAQSHAYVGLQTCRLLAGCLFPPLLFFLSDSAFRSRDSSRYVQLYVWSAQGDYYSSFKRSDGRVPTAAAKRSGSTTPNPSDSDPLPPAPVYQPHHDPASPCTRRLLDLSDFFFFFFSRDSFLSSGGRRERAWSAGRRRRRPILL